MSIVTCTDTDIKEHTLRDNKTESDYRTVYIEGEWYDKLTTTQQEWFINRTVEFYKNDKFLVIFVEYDPLWYDGDKGDRVIYQTDRKHAPKCPTCGRPYHV